MFPKEVRKRLGWWLLLNVVAAFFPLFCLMLTAWLGHKDVYAALLETSDIAAFVAVLSGATCSDILRLSSKGERDGILEFVAGVCSLGFALGAAMLGILAVDATHPGTHLVDRSLVLPVEGWVAWIFLAVCFVGQYSLGIMESKSNSPKKTNP